MTEGLVGGKARKLKDNKVTVGPKKCGAWEVVGGRLGDLLHTGGMRK